MLFFLLLMGAIGIACSRPYKKERTPLRHLGYVLAAAQFEWISGIRRYYPMLIGLYLFALILSWVRVLPLVLLWFLTIVLCSFFSHNGPLNILREEKGSSRHLLWRKLRSYGQMLVILYLPIVLIQLGIYPDLWLFVLLFLLVQLILLAATLFYKYATYIPNQSSKNDIILAMIGLSGALPFLLPLPLCFAVIYFFRAQKRLNYFLND